MTSYKTTDYDALEATTSIEDMTENEHNQEILWSLRNNDGNLTRVCIFCDESHNNEATTIHPGSSEELG